MRNLFRLKSKNCHPACAISEGVCTCKEIMLVKRNEMLKLDGKNIQTLTKYLNHLDI